MPASTSGEQRRDAGKTHNTGYAVRKMRSGRYQVSVKGPDGDYYYAPVTFTDLDTARTWGRRERLGIEEAIARDIPWVPPAIRQAVVPAPLFADFAADWLLAPNEVTGLRRKPKTIQNYQGILDRHLLPQFGHLRVTMITDQMVRSWHARLLVDHPTQRANVYVVLSAIMNAAVRADLVDRSPCRIVGAGHVTTRQTETILPTEATLAAAAAAMPERTRLAVYLGACGLRSGEVRALRRRDIDLDKTSLTIRDNVSQVTAATAESLGYTDGRIVGTPKTARGARRVPIPAWLVPVVRDHLERFVGERPEAWLFAAPDGRPMGKDALWEQWCRARAKAGIPGFRFHDLRHWGATMQANRGGASPVDSLALLGQSSTRVLGLYLEPERARHQAVMDAIPALV